MLSYPAVFAGSTTSIQEAMGRKDVGLPLCWVRDAALRGGVAQMESC